MAWDAQGAKKHQLEKTLQPNLIFFIKAMVSENTTKQIILQLGFECYDLSLLINHSYGIWVLWNKMTIIAYVLLKEDRAIHMLVFETSTQKFSIIDDIYTPAQP